MSQPGLTFCREVEQTSTDKGGYTQAADLWSLGVLTATLLTGSSVVPREEMTQLSQIQIVERFLGTGTLDHWQDIPPRALKFLHGLLELNPEKRLTATEALDHSWFKKPLSEAALLEERYQKILRFWRKREDDEAIVYIPGGASTGQEDQIIPFAPKSRRKIPDSTLSPYFGLDRHLQPKIASKRKMILDTLYQSGSPFLVTEQNQARRRTANATIHRQEIANVKTVEGLDLFGSFRSSKPTSQQDHDPDEISLVPTTAIVTHSEGAFGFDMSDPLEALLTPAKALDEHNMEGGAGGGKRKRSRQDSEDPDERSIRDGVARALPRYITSKVLRDPVEKKRQEMKSKNFSGLVIRSSVPTA